MIHHFRTPTLTTAAIVVWAHIAVPCALAETEATLTIELSADGLTFHLVGDDGSYPWVLQHSQDGKAWQDLLFLDREEDEVGQGADVAWSALPERSVGSALFRAFLFEKDDPAYREYLAARALWRPSGFDHYQYELRQNFGPISWHGNVTVSNHEIISFETIELQPPFFETPKLPTIDDLFDRIANATAQQAETIDVSWHPDFGFPASAFIDLSTLIADEEQSWKIESFSPLP